MANTEGGLAWKVVQISRKRRVCASISRGFRPEKAPQKRGAWSRPRRRPRPTLLHSGRRSITGCPLALLRPAGRAPSRRPRAGRARTRPRVRFGRRDRRPADIAHQTGEETDLDADGGDCGHDDQAPGVHCLSCSVACVGLRGSRVRVVARDGAVGAVSGSPPRQPTCPPPARSRAGSHFRPQGGACASPQGVPAGGRCAHQTRRPSAALRPGNSRSDPFPVEPGDIRSVRRNPRS